MDRGPLCASSELQRHKRINERLNWYLEYHQLIDRHQCGFRSSRGTIDHLVRLEEEIKRAFLRKQHLIAIFFDIKKAYDTCWKYGILEALHKHGLRGNLPLFIKNFLENRSFQVRVGTTLSGENQQELGVPQGSVLSPTLFSVAINSVLKALPPSIGKMLYVDDLTIYSVSSRLEGAERQISKALRSLQEWTKQTGFTFAPAKSVCVHFHRKRSVFPEPQFSLGGVQIPVRSEVKYLGLIFDSKLTWMPHLRNLKNRCSKAMDILRVVSRQKWGADRTVLLRLYRALIRSKLDYGCQAYGSASNSSLKILDPIHHQGLRIALGAFRTSPFESLYVEAHEPSLTSRRRMMDLQYFMRLQKIQSHPTTELVNDSSLDERFLRRKRGNPPFSVRTKRLIRGMNIETPAIARLNHKIKPPWLVPDLEICNVRKEISKKEMNEQELKQAFLEHQAEHTGIFIYTDGSKDAENVGSSMVVPSDGNMRALARLPENTSVCISELYAIRMAIEHFRSTTGRICSIFTDSQSALCMLNHVYTKYGIVREIHGLLFDLYRKGRKVHLCWVPSHVGIAGNELADKAAKEASQLPNITDIPVEARDMHPSIKKGVMESWQRHWSSRQDIPENKLQLLAFGGLDALFPDMWKLG